MKPGNHKAISELKFTCGLAVRARRQAAGPVLFWLCAAMFVPHLKAQSVSIPDRPEKLSFPPLVYEPPAPESYRIKLKSAGESTTVSVLNAEGAPESSANAQRIVQVIADDLK